MRLSLPIVILVMTVCRAGTLRTEPVVYLPPSPALAAAVATGNYWERFEHAHSLLAPSSQPAHHATTFAS